MKFQLAVYPLTRYNKRIEPAKYLLQQSSLSRIKMFSFLEINKLIIGFC